ncbi:uncharacterized protein LOC127717279 [Mytilus californianus]|uniref:uncharacterized protein LOC127717279 n=1 Tax=Mytilus californianus TaxID=6549 RepID=UPI002246D13E|nr:uncharacterized protein LOC127717279 [Mytilus californianus]
MEPGFKWVWQPNFNRGDCDQERYQPFKFSTDGNTDCAYLKGQCYSEGQITASNGSNKEDRLCHCDRSGGYTLVKPAFNAGYCLPSVEDCSCYKSPERDINGSQNEHIMKSYGNKQIDLVYHVEAYNDPSYNMRTHENYKRKTFVCIFILFLVMLMAFCEYLLHKRADSKPKISHSIN